MNRRRDDRARVGVPTTLDDLARDPGRAAELPLETLLELRRQLRHLDVDLERHVAEKLARRQEHGDDRPRALPVAQVAELLGLERAYVYALVRRGALPAIHVGKYVRVPEDALRAWLAAQQRTRV